MRTTGQTSIPLPNDRADAVKSHVASGTYTTEVEVTPNGLRAGFALEDAIECWLRTEVAAAYDGKQANRSRNVSPETLRARLSERHRCRLP